MASNALQDRLYAAYSYVRGKEAYKSISALTLDHLIQERIDQITGGDSRSMLNAAGTSTSKRPSLLTRLDDMEKAIQDVASGSPA